MDKPVAAEISLWPFVIRSALLHGLIVGLLLALMAGGEATTVRPEELAAQSATQEEAQRQQQEQEAQKQAEEALKEQLAEQLKAEVESLTAETLNPEDNAKLSEMTDEDIQRMIEEANAAQDLELMTAEQLATLTEQLRQGTMGEVRGNLKAMRRDLLLSQVRAFIRGKVAPDIKNQIDKRLKEVLGEKIRQEAVTQTAAEKQVRLEAASQELQAAVKELQGLKREQDTVATGVQRKRLAEAAQGEGQIAEKAPANEVKVEAALKKVEQASPAVAEAAKALQGPVEEKAIAPAVAKAAGAIETARQAAGEQAKVPAKAPAEQKQAAEAVAAKERAAATAQAQEASGKMAARLQELQGLSAKLAEELRSRKPDDIQREVVAQALKDVEPTVRKEVEKEVQDTAVPLAAERLMKALEQDLVRRKLDNKEFREFVEKDIRQALAEEMGKQQPDARLAESRTRATFELRDRKSVEEARQQVAEAARKLRELADQEDTLREKAARESADKDAPKQQKMANDVRDTKVEAGQAVAEARRATAQQDVAVAQATAELRKDAAEKAAETAAKALQVEKVPEAKEQMAEVSKQLRQSAEALEKLEQGLAQEAAAMKERASGPVDLAKALGAEKAGQAVEKVGKAAGEQAKKETKPQVAQAANSVNMEGALDEGAGTALRKIQALDNKLAQMGADGRGFAEELAMGMMGPGEGLGGLGGLPGQGWRTPWGGAMTRQNLEAYRKFMEDMRNRLNPDNYYTEEQPVEGLDSQAQMTAAEGPALIFIEKPTGEAARKEEPQAAQRTVPQPTFVTKAFGAAAMMEKPVVIDGDLSDWGELRHPLTAQYQATENKVPGGPEVYVRWSPEGLYFAYTIKDPTGIQPCAEKSWSGDCMELMLDTANTRWKEAYMNPTAQKLDFTPFGFRGTKVSVVEVGRGLRGKSMALDYPDATGVLGKSAGKLVPGGYSVEIFLSRRALAKALLMPGKYIAMNYSVDTNYGDAGYQWSASQFIQTWQKPDTWGDVLLLGSDAKLRFFESRDPAAPDLKALVPNDPMGVEVQDADMNINYLKADRVAAQLVDKELGTTLLVVLKETGPSTGIFRGTVSTQPHFQPPQPSTLNTRSGDAIEMTYVDARSEYGEKNRRVTAEVQIGWPIMKVGGR